MNQSLRLLDQIIGMEKERDAHFRKWAIQNNKGTLSLGESQILFFLKNLKELIEQEAKEL
jgi:hypothetical protein